MGVSTRASIDGDDGRDTGAVGIVEGTTGDGASRKDLSVIERNDGGLGRAVLVGSHFDSGRVVIPELNERKSDEKDDVEGKEKPRSCRSKVGRGRWESGGVVCCQSEKAKAVEACKCAIDQVVSSPKPLENRDGAWLIPSLSLLSAFQKIGRTGQDGTGVSREKERVPLNFRSVL